MVNVIKAFNLLRSAIFWVIAQRVTTQNSVLLIYFSAEAWNHTQVAFRTQHEKPGFYINSIRPSG